MTRETKVGLVVGTGIILLIGIIVSDHLSTQNREQPRTVAPPGYVDATPVKPRDPDVNKAPRGRTDAGQSGAEARNDRAGGGNAFGGHLDEGAKLQSFDRVPPTDGKSQPPPQGGAVDRNLEKSFAEKLKENPETRVYPPGDGGGGTRADGSQPRGPDARGSVTPPPFGDGDRNPGDVVPPGPPPVAIQPQPTIHYTQPRETLWSLSQRYYGDGKYFGVIAKANPDKLLANGGLRDGVRLEIPNKSLVVPAAGGAAGKAIACKRSAPHAGPFQIPHVRHGDIGDDIVRREVTCVLHAERSENRGSTMLAKIQAAQALDQRSEQHVAVIAVGRIAPRLG